MHMTTQMVHHWMRLKLRMNSRWPPMFIATAIV